MHSLAVATATPTQDPALSARTFSNNPTLTAALNRIRVQVTPIPYSRTCFVCSSPIFSADTSATETPDGWQHAACEPVSTGTEVDGSDATDNRPTETDLNTNYLIVNDWQKIEVWLDPKTGLTHLFGDALAVQSKRDASGWSFTD